MNKEAVRNYLTGLQQSLMDAFCGVDAELSVTFDSWSREEGGGGDTRALSGGSVFEKGGVNFSHVMGDSLPPSASAQRPQLAGRSFEAMGVSVVMHPKNPHVPTSHANVRFFVAEKPGEEPVWWFGGGFDLTPFFPNDADIHYWHETARNACQPFGEDIYPEFKRWCDEYFYLKHRGETRGVGGLFFDDLNRWEFDRCFALQHAVGDAYARAYVPIVERRRHHPYTQEEREFQQIRRGRYVEFNLVYDRGTLFGLQSGGRTESILMSMPPVARWHYLAEDDQPSDYSARLAPYLVPREWL